MNRAVQDRLSVVASAFGADPREAARLSRVAGFRGMMFDVWTSTLNLPELSITGRREFHNIVTSQNQELIGLQMDLGPKGLSPGTDVDLQISRMDRAMEAAAGLQARLVCVDIGPLPRPTIAATPKPQVSKEMAGLIIIPEAQEKHEDFPPPQVRAIDQKFASHLQSALFEIGQKADRYGVIVAFSSSLAGFAALTQGLASVTCPWFGIDLDPVAILRDDWTKDEIFSAAGQLVRHVRARDAISGDNRRARPVVVGSGSTNWDQFLSLLDDAGYNNWLTVDPSELNDRPAAALEGCRILKALNR